MGLFDKIKNFFGKKEVVETKPVVSESQNVSTLANLVKKKEPETIDLNNETIYFEDVWSYIDPLKNTQSHHIISVIGFDEWIDMEELRRRIKEMFFIEYKNEKSLYPYIKTLTDVGLLENTSVGGKRKWKKKEFIITLKPKVEQTIQNKVRLKA